MRHVYAQLPHEYSPGNNSAGYRTRLHYHYGLWYPYSPSERLVYGINALKSSRLGSYLADLADTGMNDILCACSKSTFKIVATCKSKLHHVQINHLASCITLSVAESMTVVRNK